MAPASPSLTWQPPRVPQEMGKCSMVCICIALHSLFIVFTIINMVTCIMESTPSQRRKKQKNPCAQSHCPDVPSTDVSYFLSGLYYLFF